MLKRSKKDNSEVVTRLLQVAEELFAEKGFAGTGVREITQRASTHISAVSYHFGGKKELYLAVFKYPFVERANRIRTAFAQRVAAGCSSPDQVIRALSEAVILGPMDDRERSIHFRLLAREMSEPTEAFDIIRDKAIGPLVSEAMRALAPFFPDLTRDGLNMAVLSIFAQIIYFNFARTKVSALTGRRYDSNFKKELVEHITHFSLTGLKGLAATW